MVIVIKKGATPAEVQAALAKFNIYPRPVEEGPSFFGALKKGFKDIDGLEYQRKIREYWD